MTLFLFGHPGCGKSYFAEKLATQLSLTWIDTDVWIERQGIPCSEIRREVFREIERDVLLSIPNVHLVALGGGILLDNRNQLLVNSMVFLDCPKDILKSRHRESFGDFETFYSQRREFYLSLRAPKIDPSSECALDELKEIYHGL